MRRAVAGSLCALALLAPPAHAADWWSRLWQNADQRGERLLRDGDAAAAAQTFADPRRRAYADLRAGHFAAAASGFGRFDDSDAHYNRGNALARAGRLKDALAAYDAALARDPGNRDARHNRELVKRALQRQQPPDSRHSPPGADGQSDGSRHDRPGQNRDRGGNTSGKPGQSAPSGGNARAGKEPPKAGEGGANGIGSESTPTPPARTAAGSAGDSGHARNDARAQAGKPAADTLEAPRGQPGAGSPATPPTEKQLAEDQWLRRIPDDPGGLLRRKFMIEHLMREQGDTP
ncbi:MAG: tetratricopeptide repeat protein [Betaproteobacteria bacterium]|nr:tetratricopeptide repeat protein [Betaproteobacteria bacterium]